MNNYRIISNIGSGAYSTVHKAIDVTTGHIVAIKKIPSEDINIQQIIKRQVAFLTECTGHPNIIQLQKYISTPQFTYLVFEFMGMDLISYYKSVQESRKRKLYDQQISYISYQLCNALNFLHQKGIMHRDIKPQNVLIDPETLKVKLIDFGFAKFNHSPINTNYMVTRWYRPMQIVLNLPYNQKVDVFAAGALILELYLGSQIFRSSSNIDQFYWIINICGNPSNSWIEAQEAMNKLNLNMNETSPRLNQYLKNLRLPAADLIIKMLKTSPKQRISMKEVLDHAYFTRFKIVSNQITKKLDYNLSKIPKKLQLFRNPSQKRNRAFSTQQQTLIINPLSSRQFTTKTQTSQNLSQTHRIQTNLRPLNNPNNLINKTQEYTGQRKCFIKRVSNQKKLVQQKSRGLKNRIKSMSGHGINVFSLKKLKIHRQIINQNSKGKHQQKTKGQVQFLKLNPKKQRPMFLRVKQKINEGRLNERGQHPSQVSTGISKDRVLGTQILTKIQSSAHQKVRKVSQYKEYMFKE